MAENHIKAWKTHLAADRTSCTSAAANQLRLFLHAGAYWLMWTLRAALPSRSSWRHAQFDTLRLRLIKIAARVVELKTRTRSTCPPPARQHRSSDDCSSGCRAWRPPDATPRQQSQPARAPQPETKSQPAPSRESAAIAVAAGLAESRIQRQNPPRRRKRTPLMHRSG